MPTYLIHGFRWQHALIRIHIILHDLEDAAPEWVMAPATSVILLNSFYTLYDFLPPSNPPSATSPLPPPTEKVVVPQDAVIILVILIPNNYAENRFIINTSSIKTQPVPNAVWTLHSRA